MIFDKEANTLQLGEEQFFQQMVLGKLYIQMKRMKLAS